VGYFVLVLGAALIGASAALSPDLMLSAQALTREPSLPTGVQLFRITMAAPGLLLAVVGWLLRERSKPAPATSHPVVPWRHVIPILTVAAVARTIQLSSDLWYDEIVTLIKFVRLPTADLLTTYTTPNNHILYSLCAQASIALFGESSVTLRLPALLFGLASIVAVLMLGCYVTSRTEATLSATLLAVSYHHAWFSQNARGYTGLLLWTVLGTWLLIRALRENRRRLWLGYALIASLAMYTHLSAVFVFTTHGIVYLLLALRRLFGARRADDYPGVASAWPIIGFALAALLTMQSYAILIPQMVQAFAAQAGHNSVNPKVAEWTNPLWTAVQIARGLPLPWLSGVGAIGVGLVCLVGFVSYFRSNPVFASVIILTIPVTLGVLIALSFHIWPRYFFSDAGFAVLVLFRGIFVSSEWICAHWKTLVHRGLSSRRLALAMSALMLVVSSTHLMQLYPYPKQAYRDARNFTLAQKAPHEHVVTVGLASFAYRNLYAPRWRSINSVEDLLAAIPQDNHLWLLFSFPKALDSSHPHIRQQIRQRFEMVRAFPGTLGNGTIYVCRSR